MHWFHRSAHQDPPLPQLPLAPWVDRVLGAWAMTPSGPVRADTWTPDDGARLGEVEVSLEGYARDILIRVSRSAGSDGEEGAPPFSGLSAGECWSGSALAKWGLDAPDYDSRGTGTATGSMTVAQVELLGGLRLRLRRTTPVPPWCSGETTTVPIDPLSLDGRAPEPVIPPSAWPSIEPWEASYCTSHDDAPQAEYLGLHSGKSVPVVSPEEAGSLSDEEWRRRLHPSIHWAARRGLPASDLFTEAEETGARRPSIRAYRTGPLRCLVCGTRIADGARSSERYPVQLALTGSRLVPGGDAMPERRTGDTMWTSHVASERGRRAVEALCPECGSILGRLWSPMDDRAVDLALDAAEALRSRGRWHDEPVIDPAVRAEALAAEPGALRLGDWGACALGPVAELSIAVGIDPEYAAEASRYERVDPPTLKRRPR